MMMAERARRGGPLIALCAPVVLAVPAVLAGCSVKPTTGLLRPAAHVLVTPDSLDFGSLNSARQLRATVVDEFGQPLIGAPVSWTSANRSVALVGAFGLVTAVNNGSSQIVAASGAAADTVTVTVAQLAATLTKLSGDGQRWATGATLPQALQVRAVDSGGTPVAGATVAFSVLSGGGSLVGHAPPTTLNGITAVPWTLGAAVGTQEVSASLPPTPPVTFTATAAVAGGPASAAVFTGDAQTGLEGWAVNFPPAVIVRDAGGLPVGGDTVTFAVASGTGSSTGDTVTTNAQGVAAVGSWVVGSGANTLTAVVSGSAIAGSPVTFHATGAAPAYTIDVSYITPVTPAQQQAVDSAVALWERIIYGAVSPIPLNNPANQCFPGEPAINQTVNSVLVFINIEPIDGPGGILGQAGPCLIRANGYLPVTGLIQLDVADLDTLASQGLLDAVITHEMGHVLGFGTVWGSSELNLIAGPVELGGTDPHFVGAQAIAAFDGMGGLSYTGGTPVPVENTGGPATVDGHWRESVFHTELMTGYLNPYVPNPLSVLTIASMGDEGYTVNYAAAQPYTQVFAVRAGGSAPPVRLVNDILHNPIYVLSPAGQVMGVIRR